MARKRKHLSPIALVGILALLVFLYIFNTPAQVTEEAINETVEEEKELPPPVLYNYTPLEDNTTLPPKVSVGGQVFIISR